MRPTAYSTVMIEAARKYLNTVKDTIPEEYYPQIINAYYAGMARGLRDEDIEEAQGHLAILQGKHEAHQGLADNYKERAERIRKDIEIMQAPMKYRGEWEEQSNENK